MPRAHKALRVEWLSSAHSYRECRWQRDGVARVNLKKYGLAKSLGSKFLKIDNEFFSNIIILSSNIPYSSSLLFIDRNLKVIIQWERCRSVKSNFQIYKINSQLLVIWYLLKIASILRNRWYDNCHSS